MKPTAVQQEILLFTGTTFSEKPFCENGSKKPEHSCPAASKLEEACWNGLLEELLPGMIEKANSGKSLYLWQIWHGNSFMRIHLCEYPKALERYKSIDPYSFVAFASYS